MKALISIDYTYDFVATDGKLTTGEYGQQIEEALVKVPIRLCGGNNLFSG